MTKKIVPIPSPPAISPEWPALNPDDVANVRRAICSGDVGYRSCDRLGLCAGAGRFPPSSEVWPLAARFCDA